MSVQANELRIGNLLYYSEGDTIGYMVVSNITKNSFVAEPLNQKSEDCNNFQEGFNPIPLTPNILEKCGFTKNKEWAILYFNPRMGIRFYDFNYAECDIIQDQHFVAFKNSHMKYLHQLQNLYFALTNEELNITL